jgi:hypothetical protein
MVELGLGLGLGPRARIGLGPGFLYWFGKKTQLAMNIQVYRKKIFAVRGSIWWDMGLSYELLYP